MDATDSAIQANVNFQGEESLEKLTKRIAKGGGVAFAGGIVGNILGFGLNILLGRVLGPRDYGLYALGISVSGFVRSNATLGLGQGVIRFCSMYRGEGDKARIKGVILSSLLFSAISSFLMSVFLFIFSSLIAQRIFHSPELTPVLMVFALSLPFYVLLGVSISFAVSFQRIDFQQGVQNVFRPLLNLVLVGLAFMLGFRLEGAICGFLISGMASAGLGLYFLRKIFPEIKSMLKPIFEIKRILRYSIPIFFINISYLLLSYTDRIILGYFKDAKDVGFYNAGSILAMQTTLFLSAFISISSPIVADLHNRKKIKELENILKRTTRWAFSLTVPIFLFLFIFSNSTIALVFGYAFRFSAPILAILVFAQFVNVSVGPLGMLLQMTGRQDVEFYNGLILLIINVVLNIWLIPIYGGLGAAIATGTSLVLIHIARLVEVCKLFRIHPYDINFIKPVVAGIITAFFALIIALLFDMNRWYLMIAFAFAIFLFYTIVLLMIGLDKVDKEILYVAKKKVFDIFL